MSTYRMMRRWGVAAAAVALTRCAAGEPAFAQQSGVIPQVTPVPASSLVLTGGARTLLAAAVTPTAAGFLLVFDAAAAPADGAVVPAACYAAAANVTTGVTFAPPLYARTAWTLVFSSTGCFTKTASAVAYISAEAE